MQTRVTRGRDTCPVPFKGEKPFRGHTGTWARHSEMQPKEAGSLALCVPLHLPGDHSVPLMYHSGPGSKRRARGKPQPLRSVPRLL